MLSHITKQNRIRLKSGSSEPLFFLFMHIFIHARCSVVENYADAGANEDSAPFSPCQWLSYFIFALAISVAEKEIRRETGMGVLFSFTLLARGGKMWGLVSMIDKSQSMM